LHLTAYRAAFQVSWRWRRVFRRKRLCRSVVPPHSVKACSSPLACECASCVTAAGELGRWADRSRHPPTLERHRPSKSRSTRLLGTQVLNPRNPRGQHARAGQRARAGGSALWHPQMFLSGQPSTRKTLTVEPPPQQASFWRGARAARHGGYLADSPAAAQGYRPRTAPTHPAGRSEPLSRTQRARASLSTRLRLAFAAPAACFASRATGCLARQRVTSSSANRTTLQQRQVSSASRFDSRATTRGISIGRGSGSPPVRPTNR